MMKSNLFPLILHQITDKSFLYGKEKERKRAGWPFHDIKI